MARVRLGVLISGRGSNMEALVTACERPDYPAEVALVLSNRIDAPGIQYATEQGIPTAIIDHKAFIDRASFEEAVNATLKEAAVELVCLAGFMRVLEADFVNRWRDRIINIHPSLLPAFKGLHTHERTLAGGVRISGCTVHFVRPEMDNGPIIIQAAVPVLQGDTPATLAARILAQEHRIYPEAVRLVASGEARVVGDIVEIDSAATDLPGLTNPEVPEGPL